MFGIRFTRHAHDRVENRLKGHVTEQEILDKLNQAGVKVTDAYKVVEIKRFDSRIEIYESDNHDSNSKGDVLDAVVRNGNIVTVMLRKSTSKSNRY